MAFDWFGCIPKPYCRQTKTLAKSGTNESRNDGQTRFQAGVEKTRRNGRSTRKEKIFLRCQHEPTMHREREREQKQKQTHDDGNDDDNDSTNTKSNDVDTCAQSGLTLLLLLLLLFTPRLVSCSFLAIEADRSVSVRPLYDSDSGSVGTVTIYKHNDREREHQFNTHLDTHTHTHTHTLP